MAGFNEVGKSAVAELVSVLAITGTLFAPPDTFPAGVLDEGDAFGAGVISGGVPIVLFDAAASEQVTRAMRSSVVMRSLWRAKYAVNGVEAYSEWTPIGETIRVPRGAVYVATEYDGEVISGGPWLAIGGGPKY